MIFEIKKYPDPILLQPTEPFDFNRSVDEISMLERDMIETMLENNGIGLAANQAGFTESFIAMKLAKNNQCVVLYNPELIEQSNETVSAYEGCLSFPGIAIHLERAKSVKLKYQTRTGDWVTDTFTDIDARCFIHEMEHLSGKTFKDSLPSEEKIVNTW